VDITILCSSEKHPIRPRLVNWMDENINKHNIELVRKKSENSGGDLLFLISCSEIIDQEELQKYKKSLVVHASDLPLGRGWSPHIWQILEGATSVCVSLLEAEGKVDSGKIWHQVTIDIPQHFLFDEINRVLFEAEISLMDYAVKNFHKVVPYEQSPDVEPTYYPKRLPADSRVDPGLSIKSQFNLIRICDTGRFPAFFELYGNKYFIKLEKISE